MNIFPDDQGFLFGQSIYRRSSRYGPIRRPQLEFVIIHSGAATVNADGASHELSAGRAALVYSAEWLLYDYRSAAETRVTWCEAGAPRLGREALRRLKALPPSLPISPRMEALQRMGVELERGSGPDYDGLRNMLGRAVCMEYVYQAHLVADERPMPAAVLRGKRFIEENFTGPCDLPAIARSAYISPQHLAKLFKAHLSLTPVQYLWRLRADEGARLLARTGLSVAEIAYRCGYQNPNHFSRQIKHRFGQPPTEYRRRCWYRAAATVPGPG